MTSIALANLLSNDSNNHRRDKEQCLLFHPLYKTM